MRPASSCRRTFPKRRLWTDSLAGSTHSIFARPCRRDRLGAVAPSEIADSLRNFKSAGLLDDGAGWTLKAGAARSLARELDRVVDRAVEADQLLTDALLKRRQAP